MLLPNIDRKFCCALADALEVFGKARLPSAHGKNHSPSPQLVREFVIGGEKRTNVFELILRVAKRWQG